MNGMKLGASITGHNYQMIRSIMEALGKEFHIAVAEEECFYVMVCSGFMGYNLNLADTADCEEMRRFVSDFLAEISELTGISYNQDEKVMNVLSMHLKA